MSKQEKTGDLVIHESSRTVEEKDEIKPYMFIKKLSDILDSIGVEATGIERVSPYRRSTNKAKQLITVIGLWFSACGGLSSMSVFYLGPLLFGLGLKKSMITGMLGQFFGCLVAAYCSLMGPRSGCRQMVTARFLFGWWMVKLVAIVSIVGVMGWSVVNCIVGGQILNSVSDGKVLLVVSIVIIAVVSLCISIGGIRPLLKVEALLSVPVMTAFMMLYIVLANKYHYLSLADAVGEDSATIRGNAISFFALCFSTTSTWGSIAADYYILFPQDTPDLKVFALTFFGIFLPTSFVGIVALLIGNIAMNYTPWAEAYDTLGMGGLLAAVFEPWGAGGKFLLVLIFLSLISNNIINTYLAVFGMQIIGLPLARVPRWLWSLLMTGLYLALSIIGRYKFATILGNFLPMVGYWISIYFFLLLEENTIFRTKRMKHLYTKEFEDTDSDTSSLSGGENCNYNFLIWNTQGKLTQGFAATVAFLCGAAGAAVGMSQTYWVGPLARKVGGEYGGDIAMWLCMGFSGVVYPWLRYLELKKFGR
ncbi:hypothetical protein METBIDRAFT_32790 [Metschnikowia bicuspidata var. bicuspidata NRRL YB-4993]|uniref:Uncharacterized protein n=1 Tax=Metschnikowia bicuspidata var. bicuspidata NRRL YB-4993 TaxID=869754 RepID=A0A1A0H6R1_9ASCO|nr:hypothetical protein METBIDRAFT_32790 [Metschnikowia bicuspidata var. bicuspidata NRRL YB-4993]OBA19716.1 hypothetical protein METBIDRAFT_32790 [Metschnikowia bicuspidata var. bicuspidata NRRL YB-4993]